MIHAFIPGHVRLVHDLDMSHILHAGGSFPAGDDEPNREPLLNAQRLAILAVGHDHVLHGLRQRKGVSKFSSVSPFRHQPARAFVHASLVQQHGKQHAAPFAATGHPVDELDRQPQDRIVGTMDRGRTVSMAFQEMNPGNGRQLLQIRHGETQRTIHHAVDREAMLLRIDLGKLGGVLLHEVERRRRDDSRIILKRGVVRHVIDAVSGSAARWLAVDMLRVS